MAAMRFDDLQLIQIPNMYQVVMVESSKVLGLRPVRVTSKVLNANTFGARVELISEHHTGECKTRNYLWRGIMFLLLPICPSTNGGRYVIVVDRPTK